MSTNTDIKDMLVNIERVLEATHRIIDSMQTGERKQIKNLAEEVGQAVGKAPKDVLGYVNDFAHNTKIAYVTRGKHGGIIKGTKPVKTVKKAEKAEPVVHVVEPIVSI